MPTLNIPRPSEKQLRFLTDQHKTVGYGGARGDGKSWAVRVKAVLLCLRKTYPELQENHILPLCQLLRCYSEDPEERIAVYNDGKKHILFPNGSRILFRYCDTDSDAQRFQGTEVDVLFVDEATQQSEGRMDQLRACVRGVNDFPKRIYCTMNPGGEGHAWVKRLFIDGQFREGEDPDDYSFIPACVTDNAALMAADPDYVRKLRALQRRGQILGYDARPGWKGAGTCSRDSFSRISGCGPTARLLKSTALPRMTRSLSGSGASPM